MGTPGSTYPHRYAPPLGALRLHLAPAFEPRSVSGMWWPYGRDLTREAAHLIDDFPRSRGKIDRLVYTQGDWDVVAAEVFTGRGRIKVGFLPAGLVGGLVLIRLAGDGIIRLRVNWTNPPRVPR